MVANPIFLFRFSRTSVRLDAEEREGKQTLRVIRFDLLSSMAIKSTHSRSIKSIVPQYTIVVTKVDRTDVWKIDWEMSMIPFQG